MRGGAWWLGALVGVLGATVARGQSEDLFSRLESPATMRSYYRVTRDYLQAEGLKKVKVAILAEGFAGVSEKEEENEKRRYLPKATKPVFTYENDFEALDPTDDTGRRVAQVLWAMTGYSDTLHPEIRLYNAAGLLSFRSAVLDLGKWPADVVVCLRNFESFGNFDGTGAVNKLIEDVVRGGTIWIQSVGEYHKKTYHSPVTLAARGRGKWVRFAGPNDFFLPFKIHADRTDVAITLSWDAFSPGRTFRGTDKDLDLYLYQPGARRDGEADAWAKSELKQTEAEEPKEGETNLAIERIERRLRKHKDPYVIAIRHSGGNVDASRFRVTIFSKNKKPFLDPKGGRDAKEIDPVEVLHASETGSIMVPSDTRFGIAVGDMGAQSSRGPTVDNRKAPQVILDNTSAFFSDKRGVSGPHIAAAQFGALVALMKGVSPQLNRIHLLKLVETQRGIAPRSPTADLQADIKNLVKDGFTLGAEFVGRYLTDRKWSGLFEAIETAPLGGAWYSDPDIFVIAVAKHPLDMDPFKDVSDDVKDRPENHAFYVYPWWNGTKYEYKGFVKLTDQAGGGKYPWQVLGGTSKDYVLLRGWYELRLPNPLRSAYFRLPTPKDLAELVAKE